MDKLNKYIEINENRHKAEVKYIGKIEAKFKEVFNVDVKKYLFHFRFLLLAFMKDFKIEHLTDLKPNEQAILRKTFEYYDTTI